MPLNWDTGASRAAAPPALPDIRVRARRLSGFCLPLHRDGAKPGQLKNAIGMATVTAELFPAAKGHVGFRRFWPRNPGRRRGVATPQSEFFALPLFPGDGAQPLSALIKIAQHRRVLAEAEGTHPVRAPS